MLLPEVTGRLGVWVTTRGHVGIWGRVAAKTRTWCLSSGPGLLLLCLWFYSSQGLSWCSCSPLPLRTVWMSGVWSDTWEHVGVWGLCCYQGHTDLNGLCCHQPQGDTWNPSATEGCVWLMILLCLGSVLMSTAHVFTGVIGIKHVENRGLCCAGPAPHCAWESWLYSLLDYSHRRAAIPCFPSQERWSHSSSWVCTSPGQSTRANPVVENVSKLALRAWEQQSWLFQVSMWWHG